VERVDGRDAKSGSDRPDDAGTGPAESQDEQVAYGGGFQPGGGMVEPDEFLVGSEDEGLPNDALAEGLRKRGSGGGGAAGAGAGAGAGTVEPAGAPDANDTGARMGDVAGYLGSDRVVGLDPSVAPEDERA